MKFYGELRNEIIKKELKKIFYSQIEKKNRY